MVRWAPFQSRRSGTNSGRAGKSIAIEYDGSRLYDGRDGIGALCHVSPVRMGRPFPHSMGISIFLHRPATLLLGILQLNASHLESHGFNDGRILVQFLSLDLQLYNHSLRISCHRPFHWAGSQPLRRCTDCRGSACGIVLQTLPNSDGEKTNLQCNCQNGSRNRTVKLMTPFTTLSYLRNNNKCMML